MHNVWNACKKNLIFSCYKVFVWNLWDYVIGYNNISEKIDLENYLQDHDLILKIIKICDLAISLQVSDAPLHPWAHRNIHTLSQQVAGGRGMMDGNQKACSRVEFSPNREKIKYLWNFIPLIRNFLSFSMQQNSTL